ncbi:hypothetical protein KJ903_02095 [Patescibacteria group bacterium]|nr:hypothetical protein [Patescibacteria group bacterium]
MEEEVDIKQLIASVPEFKFICWQKQKREFIQNIWQRMSIISNQPSDIIAEESTSDELDRWLDIWEQKISITSRIGININSADPWALIRVRKGWLKSFWHRLINKDFLIKVDDKYYGIQEEEHWYGVHIIDYK